jgi:hypothetical protein
MRAVILILIVAVVALILAVATGLIDIRQTRTATVPSVQANGAGLTATGGQAPAFDVETGKIAVGSKDKNVTVKVPEVSVQRPSDANSTATNAAH